jgi:hypothetical protein
LRLKGQQTPSPHISLASPLCPSEASSSIVIEGGAEGAREGFRKCERDGKTPYSVRGDWQDMAVIRRPINRVWFSCV